MDDAAAGRVEIREAREDLGHYHARLLLWQRLHELTTKSASLWLEDVTSVEQFLHRQCMAHLHVLHILLILFSDRMATPAFQIMFLGNLGGALEWLAVEI